jgi:WW domain-containing oxidoreductase
MFGTHWSVAAIPTLTGKTFIVTGGTTGIGFGITTQLLKHKATHVYLLSSNQKHWELAKQQLEEEKLDTSHLEWIECNLADLKSVDQVAKQLVDKAPRIDALICNAGIGAGKFKLSEDGIGEPTAPPPRF